MKNLKRIIYKFIKLLMSEYLIERAIQREYIVACGSVATLIAFDNDCIFGLVHSILLSVPNNRPHLEKYLQMLNLKIKMDKNK